MGNCASSAGVGGVPKAPVPQLVASQVGLGWSLKGFQKLKAVYLPVRNELMDGGKTRSEAHAAAAKDSNVVHEVRMLTRDLNWELDLSNHAMRAQDAMMLGMGDQNPDRNVPDYPGAEAAWREAKGKAQEQAAETLLRESIDEFLREHVDENTLEVAN